MWGGGPHPYGRTMVNGIGNEQLVRDRMAALRGSAPRQRGRAAVGQRWAWRRPVRPRAVVRRRVPGIIGR